jgi:hypothetical protein
MSYSHPLALHKINIALGELMELLPVAQSRNELEHWSALYAQCYILKLRSM